MTCLTVLFQYLIIASATVIYGEIEPLVDYSPILPLVENLIQPEEPVEEEPVVEDKPVVRVVMVSESWCGPCTQWKRFEKPKLKERGWSFGGPGSTVEELTTRTGSKYNARLIPAFIVLRDDEEVGRLYGYHSATTIEKYKRGFE